MEVHLVVVLVEAVVLQQEVVVLMVLHTQLQTLVQELVELETMKVTDSLEMVALVL